MVVKRFSVNDFTVNGPVSHENPFEVEVTADFEHASGECIEGIKGFYDGKSWVVRFSPPLEGEWTGTTRSSESALDGQEFGPLECVPSTNPDVHGRVRTDDAHPQRFRFEDGTEFKPLGFEFDWLFAYHQAQPEPCRETLETLVDRGFNYVLANVYAHTGFGDSDSEHVYGPPPTYVFGGTNEEPNHEVLNPAFFDDFDDLLETMHELGIVVHLMMQVQNKEVNWPERRSADDDRYWKYVVARYGAYPNLVWDVSKESYNIRHEAGSHDYTRDRLALLRRVDAYDHLVTAHDPDRGRSPRRFTPNHDREEPPIDDLVDFVSDQIALTRPGRYAREATLRVRDLEVPYLNAENGAEVGVENLQIFEREESTGPGRRSS
ncbi:DUF4038 domain-containing protein [Halocatena marina]|uniref:apiosidase-like domain-containing protein n=1 Tax=Halocatena marina TaxID=2934937 RepID=UPI0036070D15